MSSKKSTRKHPGSNHRSTLSLQKTEVFIHVYDLLPPGKVASVLWTFGTSLLHSAVVINGREFAFGGHDRRGMTGVFWTKPKMVPPGGTFKCEILQGFTVSTPAEIERIIKVACEEFQGTSYNLLTRNCNHFTAYLCEKLTGRPGPGWLNRAASIAIALPCVVPKEWIAPPDFETADGELVLEDDDDNRAHEQSRMLGNADTSLQRLSFDDGVGRFLDEDDGYRDSSGKGKGREPLRDTSGRAVPQSERAPLARKQ